MGDGRRPARAVGGWRRDRREPTAEPFLTGLKQPVPVALAPGGAVVVGDWGTGTVYLIRTSASASLS